MQYTQIVDNGYPDKLTYSIFVLNNIFKLDFFDLVRAAVGSDVHVLSYSDGFLYYYVGVSAKSKAADNHLVVRDVITEIFYTKIPEPHKFVLFDDLYGVCKMVDSAEETEYHGENTILITIISTPDMACGEIIPRLKDFDRKNQVELK